MIDKKVVDDYLEVHRQIVDEAEYILTWYHKNVSEVKGHGFLYYEGIEENEIRFSGDETWGGCGYERHSFQLPIELLYDSSVRDRLIQVEQECKEKIEQEKERLKLKNKEAKERREYNRYLELKKKYESQ